MNTGGLNELLTFYPETQTQGTDGYFTNAEGTGVTLRASVKPISGARKMVYTELINQEVFEATMFYNAVISKNAKVVWGSRTLYIHSIVEDFNDKSFMQVRKLILYTK